MNEHWIVYDKATGEPLWRGSGPVGSAAHQDLPETAALLVVPQGIVAQPAINLDALRPLLAASVDTSAEQKRCEFLTPGSGQALTYLRKEAEARAWIADSTAPTPFLTAEAEALQVPLAALAHEVITVADSWAANGPRIEALRLGAKLRIVQADNLAALVAAAAVDWSEIQPPPSVVP